MINKESYIKHLHSQFPSLDRQDLEKLVSENLISNFEIDLPQNVLEQIKVTIKNFNDIRTSSNYLEFHKSSLAQKGIQDPGNRAMSNSFDFHVDANGKIKLIEINTNAAFLALGLELYDSQKGRNTISSFEEDGFRIMIENEMKLQGKPPKKILKVAIIDEDPKSQRLYVEFLVYQEIFKKFGWDVSIEDYRNIDPTKFDFIYNRFTDFFLSGKESAALLKAWLDRSTCISPNPFEYFLLADKERMTEWAQTNYLVNLGFPTELEKQIQSVVLSCQTLTSDNKDQLWSERKKMFFKPLRAFGSKQSYKGSSISRKFFDDLTLNETLAQEYVPASEVTFETPEGPQAFKYDLRCYAYMGELQLVVARLYQGQVTNLRTPYGGFACVNFK